MTVGVSVGVRVGVDVGVWVGVFVIVGVELGVLVGVTVAVLVAVAVCVGVGEAAQAPLSPGAAVRKSWFTSLASMQVVKAGQATFTAELLLVQRVVAVTPSLLVDPLMAHDTLPFLEDVLMHGRAWTAGFNPQVDCA